MAGDGGANGLTAVSRATLTADDWDAVVHSSPDGWAFGLHGWQELILAVQPWGLEDHSFALRENGRLVAVVPLQFNPNNGSMASSGWGGAGPILARGLSARARWRIMAAALDQCDARARHCKATTLQILLMPVTQTSIAASWGVNPLALHGLEDVSGLSRVIDLSASEDELWAGLAADARRQVRLASQAGYFVDRADWRQSLDHYYELHCETYRRTGTTPHPRAYFSGIAEHMAANGNAMLWGVRDKMGEIVAYHNDAFFRDGAYYHTGCSIAGGSSSGAGYLLFWEAMLGAKRRGVRWYDCGAVFPAAGDRKQRGLTTFKTKFGGDTHRLFQARRIFASASLSEPARVSVAEHSSGLRRPLARLGRLLRRRSDNESGSEIR